MFNVTLSQPTSGAASLKVVQIDATLYRLDLTLNAFRIVTTDGTTSGSYGAVLLLTFGQDCQISFVRQLISSYAVDGTGVPNDAVFQMGLGLTEITAAADGTLGSTNDNLIPAENVTLSAGTATNEVIDLVDATIDSSFNGTAYLNWSGTAATIDDDGWIDVTGTMFLYARKANR